MTERKEGIAPKEITAALIKKTQEQTVSSFRGLMDRMEATVEENGEFFVKLGRGKGLGSSPVDNRALILKEGRKNSAMQIPGTDMFDYVVITEKGPKIMTMDRLLFKAYFLSPQDQYDGIFAEDSDGSYILLERNQPSLRLKECLKGDEEFVTEAMRKSIEVARDRPALTEELRKQNTAKALLALVSPTTQPPSGESTAAAPTTPPTAAA